MTKGAGGASGWGVGCSSSLGVSSAGFFFFFVVSSFAVSSFLAVAAFDFLGRVEDSMALKSILSITLGCSISGASIFATSFFSFLGSGLVSTAAGSTVFWGFSSFFFIERSSSSFFFLASGPLGRSICSAFCLAALSC